jgi:hypothetical protein
MNSIPAELPDTFVPVAYARKDLREKIFKNSFAESIEFVLDEDPIQTLWPAVIRVKGIFSGQEFEIFVCPYFEPDPNSLLSENISTFLVLLWHEIDGTVCVPPRGLWP